MLEEIGVKSRQLEHQNKHDEEVIGAFSKEINNLKAEINKLTTDNEWLKEQAQQTEKLVLELEHTKAFAEEIGVQNQRGSLERKELMSTIDLMKKEASKSLQELQRMRHLKDEKEAAAESLQSELVGQINLKETALETSTNVFLEMGRDLQKKTDESESRVEELIRDFLL